MRRADRLYRLVELIRGGRLTTARRLAERLEVSERTIYRDIADLMASGVPVDGEAGVGYVMRPGFDIPPLMFTREEITALVAGARLMQAWGGAEMGRSATEALGKIAAVIPVEIARAAEETAVHAFRMPGLDDDVRQRLDRLDAGIRTPTRFMIAYRDETGSEKHRTIRPLGLVFWGKVWTLIAWCELREDFRMFRVDRIGAAEAAGPFAPDPGRTLSDFYAREVPPEACGRPARP